MAVAMTMMSIILLFFLHVAPTLVASIHAGDAAALWAMRKAIVNKERFPPTRCGRRVTCTVSGRVIYLDLRSLGLKGRIGPEIGNLTALQQILLSDNQLSGSLPNSIGQLTYVYYLWVENNQLSGRIPPSIDLLPELSSFYFYNNYFSGPLELVNTLRDDYYCRRFYGNCFSPSSIPSRCRPIQRSTSECDAFCNATQAGGPCGGNGICSNSADGTTRKCACNQGFTDAAIKYTCKLLSQPPPLSSPRFGPPPLLPTPLPRSPPPSPPLRSPPPPRPTLSPPRLPPPSKSPIPPLSPLRSPPPPLALNPIPPIPPPI